MTFFWVLAAHTGKGFWHLAEGITVPFPDVHAASMKLPISPPLFPSFALYITGQSLLIAKDTRWCLANRLLPRSLEGRPVGQWAHASGFVVKYQLAAGLTLGLKTCAIFKPSKPVGAAWAHKLLENIF